MPGRAILVAPGSAPWNLPVPTGIARGRVSVTASDLPRAKCLPPMWGGSNLPEIHRPPLPETMASGTGGWHCPPVPGPFPSGRRGPSLLDHSHGQELDAT